MATSALTRRRGTVRRKGNYSLYIAIGFIVFVVGIMGGVMLAFGVFSQVKTNPSGGAMTKSLLRGKDSAGVQIASAKIKAVHTKAEFLESEPIIGTEGEFPHYLPLVETDHDFSSWTPPGGNRFAEYKFGDSPYSYSPHESDELARSRRYHVKKAMEHAWSNYEKYAFGKDELHPKSRRSNNRWGGMGTTLVDSLDTLWLMGMKDEFYRARDWCRDALNFNINQDVSVFETTIRSLGGLLSAYDWSGDEAFLDKAKDLGARLFKSFDSTKSGIPASEVNLMNGRGHNYGWLAGAAVLAEFTTLQIEYRALARLSGILAYKTRTEKIFEMLDKMDGIHDGLYPDSIGNSGDIPTVASRTITFGARSDSFYEYMLKVWIQGGKTEPLYRNMYDKSIEGMHDWLLTLSTPSGLVFIAETHGDTPNLKMDHLVCFMGGLLALGAYTDPQGLESERAQRDLKTAKALTYTCYQMYAQMPTGISPELVRFHEGKDMSIADGGAIYYILRPETVESLFVLYHLTGDPIYREWGWEIFQSIEKYCKTEAGYGKLNDVRNVNEGPQDEMESFFLAETIKYLYLLFDPDTEIDLLNKHVFNTEAHPMRIFPVMDQDGVKDLLKQ
mmetsp:Transcript_12847/g.30040  ORF Transcript_12847/g.30040 Transcript_12847/m.30040 type:complete len:614 (-) Transcript_12847:356-2197(-)